MLYRHYALRIVYERLGGIRLISPPLRVLQLLYLYDLGLLYECYLYDLYHLLYPVRLVAIGARPPISVVPIRALLCATSPLRVISAYLSYSTAFPLPVLYRLIR
jgi:hypothetical protein